MFGARRLFSSQDATSASLVLTSASVSEKKQWWKLIDEEALTECTYSKNSVMGMRSWRLARGLVEWISESQVRQRAAAPALQVTCVDACLHTSQSATRGWRDTSLLAA
ncbi:hypothetical protein GYH30_039952 [Glycine max]|nr:hypothetical protein GYH30_039952 [Glycine max]